MKNIIIGISLFFGALFIYTLVTRKDRIEAAAKESAAMAEFRRADSLSKAKKDSIDARNKYVSDSILHSTPEYKADSIKHAKILTVMNSYDCNEDQAVAILHHEVSVGMSKKMAIAAWGRPRDVNTTSGQNYKREQWVYNMKTYLYFDETDKIVTIQN